MAMNIDEMKESIKQMDDGEWIKALCQCATPSLAMTLCDVRNNRPADDDSVTELHDLMSRVRENI